MSIGNVGIDCGSRGWVDGAEESNREKSGTTVIEQKKKIQGKKEPYDQKELGRNNLTSGQGFTVIKQGAGLSSCRFFKEGASVIPSAPLQVSTILV